MSLSETDGFRVMRAWLKSIRRKAVAALAALTAFALAMASPGVAAAEGGGVIRDAEIEETLRAYATPLWVAAGLDPNDVHIYLVGDPTLNAFVSDGQNIFVHTGLIIAARTPNEIIGVLAHETGHIAGAHGVRRREAIEAAMGPALITIGLGVLAIAAGAPDAGAALISGSQAMAMGEFVRHTQVQESSADQAAVEYLEASGQSGQGLITFFNNNLRRYEFIARRAPPYLMTHPFTSDRVEALRQRVSSQEHANAVDTPDNIARLAVMQAKLVGFMQTRGQTLARYPMSDQSAPAHYARAVAEYRVANVDAARAEMAPLLAAEPNNPYYQELMGQILFETGHAAESIPFHRRSVELTTNQPLLMFNLARSLVASDRRNLDEGIALLNHVVRLEPLNSFAWSELANARDLKGEEGLAQLASAESNYARGNFPAALSFAERARRTLPRNTPDFQRAMDISTFAGQEVQDMMEQRNGRGGQQG